MIVNFEQFLRLSSSPDFSSSSLYKLTEQEKNIVKIGILGLENFHFVQARQISSQYFGINISTELLKDIVANDIFLSVEVTNGSLQDTYARDLLSDSIARSFGFKNWPTYADKVNIDDFKKTLQSLIDSAEEKRLNPNPISEPPPEEKPTSILEETSVKVLKKSLKQRIFGK